MMTNMSYETTKLGVLEEKREKLCSIERMHPDGSLAMCCNPAAWVCREECRSCGDIGFYDYCRECREVVERDQADSVTPLFWCTCCEGFTVQVIFTACFS